jgi:hypothetical protein
MAEYDFSGQAELTDLPDTDVIGSFNTDLSDDKKKKKESSFDFSGQEDLFPKERQPLKTPSSKITSKFGKRSDPFGAGIKFHNGIDIPMTNNTPITSLGKGTVINIGDSGSKDYGRFVEVDYGGGLVLTYGHLNKVAVERGDRVSQEAIVGLSGSTGRSKGPHLHIRAKLNGKSVNPEDYFGNMHDIAIGALTNEDVISNKNYDFSGQDEIQEISDVSEAIDVEAFDFSGQDSIGEVKPIVETPAEDIRTVEERLAAGAASIDKEKITVTNPSQLVGSQITTIIPTKGAFKPDTNTAVDYWLGAIDPNYSRINSEYRSQTGKNLIEFDGKPEFIGDGKYQLTARLTKGSVELINAYISGRNKGGPEAGWEAAYFKSQEIRRQEQAVSEEIARVKAADKETFANKHPYIAAAFNILAPGSMLLTDPKSVKAGIANVGATEAQLIHNLKLLPEAIYTLERYGGDSEEYERLIRRDETVQRRLESYQSEISQPETTSGKIVSGAVTGALSFPKYAIAGSAGVAGLPLLVYVENLHRGNREAALAALPMALMVGSSHGLNQYLNSGTKIYLNTVDKAGNPVNKVVEVGRGLGNKAAFSRIREELSLDPKVQSAFLAKDSVSIASFNAFERQLLLRGTNAITGAAALAAEGGSLQDVAANFVVGLTFPVGKYKVGNLTEGKLVEAPPVDSPTKEQFLIGEKRINVPLTKAPTFGESNLPILENQRLVPPVVYPSAESPKVTKYGEPFDSSKFVGETETGFQGRGNAATIQLDMDTAALNLLDLRRSLTDKNFIGTGNVGIKESVRRQISIQKAITALEQQLPKEVIDYFEKNEAVVREGLKTNWQAVRAKEEFLGQAKTAEIRTPDQVKDNPNIETKENPIERLKNGLVRVSESNKSPEVVREIASNIFGNAGEKNKFVTPDRVLLAYDRLLNTKTKNGNILRMAGPQDLAAMGKDLVEGTKAIFDLTQIAAFHLEDFYHRKVEPSVAELANRFRITLGDAVKGLTENDFQTLFQKGMEYYDSNLADPFFSRMKQDAVERLPNRFTEEQAKNILSQHKDEFEWTSGLSEFLEANKGKKISKQELVDIIQKGQVRVEESVADEGEGTRNFAVQNRLSQIEQRLGDIQVEYSRFSTSERIKELNTEENSLLSEQTSLRQEREQLRSTRLQYSLSAYRHEKLELPGAVNSKEVKLISVFPKQFESFTDAQRRFVKADTSLKYKSPHWNEPNVVAHYRSNDRIATDNTRLYHSEEFQSDWNHDIREKGLKEKIPDGMNYVIFRPVSGEVFAYAKNINEAESIISKSETRDLFLDYEHVSNIDKVEPNPFMSHNWKELVLKRFIRDGVVAKDENGNYKYDAVSWTTAKQQMERYGKILEGKEFEWNKNSDGTYTFHIRQLGNNIDNFQQGAFVAPHELSNISLERFAELTTKEAADFVRQQESAAGFVIEDQYGNELHKAKTREEAEAVMSNMRKHQRKSMHIYDKNAYEGKFSLAEAVNIRKAGNEKYADYDVALVNMAKKIGKRFGAKYSQKEIDTTVSDAARTRFDAEGNQIDNTKIEKVHTLEITPAMRESLSKEGFSLYGLGGTESLRASEFGARNRIVTTDAFNSARNDLVKRLDEYNKLQRETPFDQQDSVIEMFDRIASADATELAAMEQHFKNRKGTFNSGLNPDAFVDQVKLLYKGIKDLGEFTKALVERYGEPIREFTEDLYWSIRDKAAEFNSKLDVKINDWQANLNKVADDPAWQIRQSENSERGSFSLRRKRDVELEDYYTDKTKHQKPLGLDFRAWMRGIALSQISTEFGQVYNTLRIAQRVVHSYESNVLEQLKLAKRIKKSKLDGPVAEAIYEGNETQKVFTIAELVQRGLNAEQIAAYKNVRAAVDNVLNLRLEGKIYAVKEKANKLNQKLLAAVPGSAEELSLKEQLLDLADAQAKMSTYYQKLKDEGYITIQRRGTVAAYIEDPAYPVGDPKRKIYNQFNSAKKANEWIQKQKTTLGIPKSTLAGSIYDIRNLREIALREKLTPSQFEDLVDRSGANANDAEVEKIRSEVYSKFPSFTYQLDREFVRGYDRHLQTAMDSIVHQAELYASSFYSKVGGEEGMKALEATGLEKSDPNLYKIASQYIKDETAPAELNWLGKKAIQARRFTYLWQLGFDINQLYLNAVAQPITQTYSYFSRVSYNGKRLTGLEPEHYFLKAGRLAAKGGDPEFDAIKTRLVAEHVLAPEFTKTLIESETGTGKTSKVEHAMSIFMRMGEKITRTHAAAEAFLIGKEKFNIQGDELIEFIVKAVDATQSNPTRGENPYVIRGLGEGGKLFYQFLAFNQMWWENLAIGVKESSGVKGKSLFAVREFAPLAIIGGVSGMPLAAFSGTMYTLLTGRDPKKDMDKFLGDDTFIEQLTRYGITTSAGLSQKLTPTAPFLDQTGRALTADTSGGIGSLADSIPAFATADQLIRGTKQIIEGKTLKGAANLTPRFIKGPIKSAEAEMEGFKTASGKVLLSKNKVTPLQIIGQAINISPTPVLEKYDRERTKKLKKLKPTKKLRKVLREVFP